MTETLSPPIRKLIAFSLFIILVWVFGGLLGGGILARIQASREIAALKARAASLESRRYDSGALERRLSEIAQSISHDHFAILTENDRAAFAALQDSVRTTIQAAGGTLISLVEIKARAQEPRVGLQFRARIGEANIKTFVERLENGSPRLDIEDLSLATKSAAPGTEGDIEIAAIAMALWLDPRRLPR
jgi:hypothetical protein